MTGCDYFDAGVCRSCPILPWPYDVQLASKDARVRDLVDSELWLPPVASRRWGFRNKAKLVVGGTVQSPTLGILDDRRLGVDLRECRLHEPGLAEALPVLADFVTVADLTPYDVGTRRGELKHLIVTLSPDGKLLVRFVLRSREAETRLRKHLPWLLDRLPVEVASLNLQPEHKAVLEGPEEIVLHGESLTMRLDDLTLHLRPQSFFQTNTGIATRLYAEARAWVAERAPTRIVDLFCGVGGFALHLAGPGRDVLGIEVSDQAVASARRSAAEAGLDVRFVAGDATTWTGATDLLVVNPPRRGLGEQLCCAIGESGVPQVLYSSCNAESLARDLAGLPGYRVTRAQLFDMFPNTDHYEVLVLAERE